MKVLQIEQFGLGATDRPKVLFSKVGIVGCGSIGQSLARMFSRQGIEVVFIELSNEKVQEAYLGIENDLNEMIDRWGVTESEKRAVLKRIHGSTNCEDLEGCDLVMEAVLSRVREESVDLRKKIFKNIEKYVAKDAIIATNSTTVVITELSNELQYKDRCISLHFSTTAPESRTIEVVRGLHTSDAAYEKVIKFTKILASTVIPVEESPGLISVRLFVPLINEACDIYMEKVSSLENIDEVMKSSFGLALGPFEMADKIGLGKVVRWMDNLYNEFGDQKYKPSPVLKRLVRANKLGRKTGEGFYKYDSKGHRIRKKSNR
jgi:3-hydroxybutyryl-CoA dehydrogenase